MLQYHALRHLLFPLLKIKTPIVEKNTHFQQYYKNIIFLINLFDIPQKLRMLLVRHHWIEPFNGTLCCTKGILLGAYWKYALKAGS